MKEYKTIAGPVALKFKAEPEELGGLKESGRKGYKDAVRQYASIIDKEAVGGWELLLIQQIQVKKLVYYSVFIGAIIGAVLGMVVAGVIIGGREPPYAGGLFLGLLIGAVFGCLGIKYKPELFNMLVFVKDE